MSSQPPYGTDPAGQPPSYQTPPPGYGQSVAYPAPAAPVVPVRSGSNGLSIASLVCGIVGIVIGFIPVCGAFVAVPLGVLSVIFGAVGRRSATKKGMATAGLVLGILAIVVSVGWWVLAAAVGTTTTTP